MYGRLSARKFISVEEKLVMESEKIRWPKVNVIFLLESVVMLYLAKGIYGSCLLGFVDVSPFIFFVLGLSRYRLRVDNIFINAKKKKFKHKKRRDNVTEGSAW